MMSSIVNSTSQSFDNTTQSNGYDQRNLHSYPYDQTSTYPYASPSNSASSSSSWLAGTLDTNERPNPQSAALPEGLSPYLHPYTFPLSSPNVEMLSPQLASPPRTGSDISLPPDSFNSGNDVPDLNALWGSSGPMFIPGSNQQSDAFSDALARSFEENPLALMGMPTFPTPPPQQFYNPRSEHSSRSVDSRHRSGSVRSRRSHVFTDIRTILKAPYPSSRPRSIPNADAINAFQSPPPSDLPSPASSYSEDHSAFRSFSPSARSSSSGLHDAFEQIERRELYMGGDEPPLSPRHSISSRGREMERADGHSSRGGSPGAEDNTQRVYVDLLQRHVSALYEQLRVAGVQPAARPDSSPGPSQEGSSLSDAASKSIIYGLLRDIDLLRLKVFHLENELAQVASTKGKRNSSTSSSLSRSVRSRNSPFTFEPMKPFNKGPAN